MSEARIQQEVRLSASTAGSVLFRNNVGQTTAPDGRVIRYGLTVGSSDLIGWTPIIVTPEMVGRRIAVFTAIEVKAPRGKISPKQINFINAVQSAGGIAGIARSADDLLSIIKTYRTN